MTSFWRALRDWLSSQATEPQASPPSASIPRGEVSSTSPARVLAQSLTEPETRGEWRRSRKSSGLGASYIYDNETRDIQITSWWAGGYGCFNSGVNTPFTLSEAETKMVSEGLKQFDQRLQDEAEQAALARLIAPRDRDRSGEAVETRSKAPPKARARARKGIAQTSGPSSIGKQVG